MITNSIGMKLNPDVTGKRSGGTFHKLPERIAKISKHYENGTYKYSYNKVIYLGIMNKVIITCKTHGDFTQTLSNHLQGKGCIICSGRKQTRKTFIEKAIEVHGNTYTYDKVVYKGAVEPVVITCRLHGDFSQLPNNHINKGYGCVLCSGSKYNREIFIEKALEVHDGGYDYGKVIYVGALRKVTITCKIHGDFKQTPNSHLQGHGCIKCSGLHSPTTEEFIEKALKVHWDGYIYDKTVYKGSHNKVTITCKIHGDFEQKANSHLRGFRCKQCANDKTNYETYKDRTTTLYYVKFTHPKTKVEAWKIGLTLETIDKRFKLEINKGYLIDVIAIKTVNDGWEAYLIEQSILKLFTKYRPYSNQVNPYLLNKGNTEVFSKDVLLAYPDSQFTIKD